MAKKHPSDELRRFALTLPETDEGTSCNKSAFRARKKAFLYLGIKDDSFNMMLKIGPSSADAERLQKESPDCYGVGSGGWVKVEFTTAQTPPIGMLKAWIEESYRLLVHKQLVEELNSQNDGKSKPRKTVKKTAKKTTPRAAASKKRAPAKKSVAKRATKKKAAKKRK